MITAVAVVVPVATVTTTASSTTTVTTSASTSAASTSSQHTTTPAVITTQTSTHLQTVSETNVVRIIRGIFRFFFSFLHNHNDQHINYYYCELCVQLQPHMNRKMAAAAAAAAAAPPRLALLGE